MRHKKMVLSGGAVAYSQVKIYIAGKATWKSKAMQRIAKVSGKGQITLPKSIREKLGSSLVRIVAGDDCVRIEPVRELGGSLKAYAKTYVPIEEAREGAARAALDDDGRRY